MQMSAEVYNISAEPSSAISLPRNVLTEAGIHAGDSVTVTTHADLPGKVLIVLELPERKRTTGYDV